MNRSISFRFTILMLVATCLSTSSVLADRWGSPKRVHWSANQQWALVLGVHGERTLSLCERTDDGLIEHWQRGYVDPVWPPNHAYVTNDGRYVVLRDRHHGLGRGHVIVILGPAGAVLGSYQLGDFLSLREILQARRSVSSIWWKESAWFSFTDSDQRFTLVTKQGTLRCFDLATGQLLSLDDQRMATTREGVHREAEQWLASDQTTVRIRGLLCLAELREMAIVATAKKWLSDPTVLFAERVAAASALTRIMGVDGAAILEEALPNVDPRLKRSLLEILAQLDTNGLAQVVATPDSEAFLQMWKRLAEHPQQEIRHSALTEVLLRDDGSFLLQHPGLIESDHHTVRSLAFQRLGAIESPEATRLLRKAITEKNAKIRKPALTYLIQREPPDAEALLRRHLDDESHAIQHYSMRQLASRGHPAATDKLNATIEAWVTFDHEGDDMWGRLFEIEEICKMVADLKLEAARDGLLKARAVEDRWALAYISGALAALGDQQSADTLHRIATESMSAERLFAVEMCRYLSDEKSAAIVQEATVSQYRDLRTVATKELTRFKHQRKKPQNR